MLTPLLRDKATERVQPWPEVRQLVSGEWVWESLSHLLCAAHPLGGGWPLVWGTDLVQSLAQGARSDSSCQVNAQQWEERDLPFEKVKSSGQY